MRRNSHNYGTTIRWRSDLEKGALVSNFERRRWVRATGDEDWNVYWASVHTVKGIFNPDHGYRLNDRQLINHFPNHYELTRKDLMVKNIKRYSKDLAREGLTIPGFVPTTYLLPADYSLFVEEFRRKSNTWIMKPTSKARGIGIFIVNKLSQVKKWANNKWTSTSAKDNYVISRYIDNPLLVGGKKFDLRLYALVTSYRPLRVYMYREGFCRFTTQRYTNDLSNLDNLYVHLTNVSIQTKADDYNEKHGGKWTLRSFRLYIEGLYGVHRARQVFEDIERIILLSLKSVQNIIINDKHCFECYGYDIIVDNNLRCWLVEVNASPSLSATTHNDRIMKHKLINDIFRVVVPNDEQVDVKHRSPNCAEAASKIGQFELMYDEISSSTGRFADGFGLQTFQDVPSNKRINVNTTKWR
eukprot:g5210.t1